MKKKFRLKKIWIGFFIVIVVILSLVTIIYFVLKHKSIQADSVQDVSLTETDLSVREMLKNINNDSDYGRKFYMYIKGDSVNTSWLGTELSQYFTGTDYDIKDTGLSLCGYSNPYYMFMVVCLGRYGGDSLSEDSEDGSITNLNTIPDDSDLFSGVINGTGSNENEPGVLIWMDETGTYVSASTFAAPYSEAYLKAVSDDDDYGANAYSINDAWYRCFYNSFVKIGEGISGKAFMDGVFGTLCDQISNGAETGQTEDGENAYSIDLSLLHGNTNIPLISNLIEGVHSKLSFAIQFDEEKNQWYLTGLCGDADFFVMIEPDSIFHSVLDFNEKTVYTDFRELTKVFKDKYGINPLAIWDK